MTRNTGVLSRSVLASLLALPVGTGMLVAAAIPSSGSPANLSPEASDYLLAALDIMESQSLFRFRVRWPSIRARAQTLAEDAETTADTYPAIEWALSAIDPHSFLIRPDRAPAPALDPDANPAPHGSILLGFPYLYIPRFVNPDTEETIGHADEIQSLIASLDDGGCGWIVDLRGNTGGNMWPMLAGLGPVLGEGVAGYFVDALEHRTPWFYRAGRAGVIDDDGVEHPSIEVSTEAYRLASGASPVAVLTEGRVFSSGEAVAISFKGRPGARSFGGLTGGFTTGNEVFDLGDGAMMALATVYLADRSGQTHPGGVEPDQIVLPDPHESPLRVPRPADADDRLVQAAAEWLRGQCP